MMFILKSLLADYTSVTLLGQHNGGTWHVKAVLEAQQQRGKLYGSKMPHHNGFES